MAEQMTLLAVGLLVGLLVLLGVCVLGYFLWRRAPKSPYLNLIPTLPLFPACTAPGRQVTQCCWPRSDEIPFAVPPRFEPGGAGGLPGRGPASSPEMETEAGGGQRDVRGHRGSLCVRSWYPVGTLLEGLYRGPALDRALAPAPGGPAPPRLCFAVEYGRSSEQLTVSLLRLAGLPPRLHGNATTLELCLLPSERQRPLRAGARGPGPAPEVNQCFVFQVSAVCVSESTLSVCVLSGRGSGRGVVGRVLYPLGDVGGTWGRVLWRDLETDALPQCSELGDVQVSLAYSPSLRRLTLGVLRGRGLQLTRDAEVFVQVSLQRQCQVVKTKRGAQVRCEGAEPHLNHRVTFKLRPQHLDQSCVRVELRQRHSATPGSGTPLGEVVLGPFMYARGPALQHWTDMLSTKQGPPVSQWHGLGRGL